MTNTDELNILLTLNGQELKDFNKLREQRGIKNGVELVRLIITEAEVEAGIKKPRTEA